MAIDRTKQPMPIIILNGEIILKMVYNDLV